MLRVSLKFSRRLAVLLLAGHAVAVACVLIVPLPLGLRALLFCALLISLLYVLLNQAGRALPMSIIGLQFEREGGVHVQCRNGKAFEARVLGSSFVAPYLTIILFKPNKAWFARSVVVLPDMLPPDLFRALRVWLKWRLGQGEAPNASTGWLGPT